MVPRLRLRPRLLAFVLCWLLPPAVLSAASPHPALSVAPAPNWITPPLDPARPVAVEEEQTPDLDYLVSERQVLADQRTAYIHFAYRVASASGLSDAAEFELTFDPAYETVALHHLRLIRDGRVEERLDLTDFDVIRQERDRDRSLYDGRLTAIHQLRDVRVGDIIDYAYTVTGSNPVFGHHYVDSLSLGWSKPIRQFRYQVSHAGADLRHRVLGDGAWEPEIIPQTDGRTELRWERSPLPALIRDTDHPSWHVAYPFIQFSAFANWSEVVAWALPLYPTDGDSPELQAQVAALRAAAPDEPGRILAALALVQEEIRYLGIELGVNSHRPSPPADTLARRFGDCKDKTLLLCTLLRALGIEADPALVNTDLGRPAPVPLAPSDPESGLHQSLPTPLAFDHVIARARLADGTAYWLDPTRLHQTGPLSQRTSGDFGQALVIREGERGLTTMQRPADAAGRLHEEVVYRSHAFDQPVDLDIRSTFTGDRATWMRAYLASTTSTKLTRDYLNYYLPKFPGATSRETVTWTDDPATNEILMHERYTVPDFWQRTDSGSWTGEVYPHAIADLVRAPNSQTRRAPLRLSYPSETYVTMRMHLHTDWEIGTFDLTVDDEHLRYVSTVRPGPRVVDLSYHYIAKRDHVPAADVAAHTTNLTKIRNDLALTLTHNGTSTAGAATDATSTEGGTNPWGVATAVLSMLVAAGVAFRVLRRAPASPVLGEPPPLPAAATPALGGWLWLFAIGVVVRCVTVSANVMTENGPYFDAEIWAALTAPDSPAHNPALAALMMAEIAGNVALFAIIWIAGILFFTRRREAPRWNIAVFVYSIVYQSLDHLAVYAVSGESPEPGDWTTLAQTVVPSLIWVPYLLRSRRVRETFVR